MNEFPFASLLPLRAAEVTLRFIRPAHFPFFHQPALTAWIRSLLGESPGYENLITIDAPECGRDGYRFGDQYRFGLYGLARSEVMLGRVLELLQGLPGSWKGQGRPMPLHDNAELVSVRDLFGGKAIATVADATEWGIGQLRGEARLWAACPAPRIRLLSPTWLSLPQGVTSSTAIRHRAPPRGGKKDVAQDRRDVTLDRVRYIVEETFIRLVKAQGGAELKHSSLPGVEERDADLFWVDCSYRDRDGKSRKMGGLMGCVDLPGPNVISDDDWLLWVLGQYVGFGQQRAFGFGRYRLESADGEATAAGPSRFESVLHAAAQIGNVERAHEVIQANLRQWRRVRQDGSGTQQPTEPDTDRLARLGSQLASGKYRPRPLRPASIPKKDGAVRHLAVPPFIDRIAQRAVLQALAPPVEQLLAEGTFGFRSGRSRQDAIREVRRAYEEGFRWVYEADIDDFFDTVDWRRLETRLRALYRDDPVVDLLLAWMQAPVADGERLQTRTAGLPQGAPLSPLLGNLFLDDFDADMENAGFRLLRYADDFIVLCRSEDDAKKAAERVEQSLAELGLELNPAKSGIRDFGRGFRWLGYVVAGSLIIDAGGQRKEIRVALPTPPVGWLARTAQQAPRPLETERLERFLRPPDAVVTDAERAASEGATLIVTGAPTLLHMKERRLRVERDGQTLRHFPLRALNQIVLIGPQHITTPALRSALEAGVTVHFAKQSGRYVGATWPGQPAGHGFGLWIRQQERFACRDEALELARAVVDARLRHQREVLRQHGVAAGRLEQFDSIRKRCHRVASIEQLNGVEGPCAEIFFGALGELVPEPFRFEGRNRRPPLDPFNVLLSLGYTILSAHVDTMVRVAGLLPWVGFYHQPHGRSPCLVNDLMEPFRDLVERYALDFIRRPDRASGDFELDLRGACQLRNHARREFLAGLDEYFRRPVSGVEEDSPGTLQEHLEKQNRRLIQWIRGDAERFIPWRRR